MFALKSFWNPKDSKLLQIRKGAAEIQHKPTADVLWIIC